MSVAEQDKQSEQDYYDGLFKERRRFDQFQRAIYEQIAAEARDGAAGDRVLEIGCGSGVQAVCLSERGLEVTAMDLSFEATRVARNTLNEAGRSALVLNADAEFLPVRDESVDACVCGLLLHHFPDFEGVAREIARIVKPGGVVVAIDANGHNPFLWMFLNVIHRFFHLPHLTPNQRAIRRSEVKKVFTRQGFSEFRFSSVTSELRRDWLGKSVAASLNYYTRAFVLKLTRLMLPQIARGNMMLAVFRRNPEA